MLKTLAFALIQGTTVIAQTPLNKQIPSADAIVLSLKTVVKALETCREPYSRKLQNDAVPFVKEVIGTAGYDKDMQTFAAAEKIANFMIEHPNAISGRRLVNVLSTMDDFSLGLSSSRMEMFKALISNPKNLESNRLGAMTVLAASLSDCQGSLFNAGDDYVGIVSQYVGAEDDYIQSQMEKSKPPK